MKQILLICLMILATAAYAQPPYSGTIFIDPDIITASDPSAITSTTYTGQGLVTMYDRRVSNWVTVNAYLFDVVWNDGLTSRAQINPEFGTVAAATVEAEKYAFLIGQLPTSLRVDVNEIWVHQGVQPFGGGNNSILIHTGQSVLYENDGIIEETLVHEASHTSLDAAHATSSGWINAQFIDNEFISTYARDNPTTEDIAESFLTWLMVRYREAEISVLDYTLITQTIPSRLSYFDSIDFELYPFEGTLNTTTFEAENFSIYPNPVGDVIHLRDTNLNREDIRLYNLLGQDFTQEVTLENDEINVANIPSGFYLLKLKTVTKKIYKQ